MGMRAALISFSTAAVAALPLTAFAAETGFFGPIIPQTGSCVCDTAMDWGCVIIVFQAVMNVLVSLSVLAVVFFIAWAGFTMITGGSNPANRTKARNRLVNAVIGLVVILGAWLIVDTVMKTLYNPDAGAGEIKFGPWNSIFAGGEKDYCLRLNRDPGLFTDGSFIGELQDFVSSGSTNSSTLDTTGSGACSPLKVQQAAAAGGVTMSNKEANTLACLANPESSCGTKNANYAWNTGKPGAPGSTAYGPFMVTIKSHAPCFETAACRTASGVNGALNCNAAFDSRGNPIPGARLNACTRAAANLNCAAVVAHCVYKAEGYGAWTTDKHATSPSSAQSKCIAQNS